MKTFKTSSGYVFKLWQPGDRVCLLVKGKFIKEGTTVDVISSPEVLSRDVMVIDRVTGLKEQFNIGELGALPGELYKITESNSEN